MERLYYGHLFGEKELSEITISPRPDALSEASGRHVLRKTGSYKTFLIGNATERGAYGIPAVEPCLTAHAPLSAMAFSKAFSLRKRLRYRAGVLHFFEPDYKFERLWNAPRKYLGFLRRFEYVIMPDYSMRIGMSAAEQIWNLFRNHALAYWMQRNGINVIPQACWSDGSSFRWCFSALPNGGTLAISMVGAMGNPLSRQAFWRGLQALFRKVTPDKVWLFGLHPNKDVEDFISTKCKVELININHHGQQRGF